MNKKTITIILIIVPFGLLIPGLMEPIFELSLDTKVDAKIAQINANVLTQKRSILGAVNHLINGKRYLVGFLIFFFSVLIPVLKGITLLVSLTKKDLEEKYNLSDKVSLISKWSMADVFVVAIFLAFLATTGSGATSNTSVNLFGSAIPIKMTSIMSSSLGSGFYFFLGYCMLSIVTGILSRK